MRFIAKAGSGGYNLDLSHSNPPLNAKDAGTRWASYGHKTSLLAALLEEQYYLCCYSEIRADEFGLGYHIEHVLNKQQSPERTFDYLNLAASALDSKHDLSHFGRVGHERFGGHAPGKMKPYDTALFMDCHQVGCRDFFGYLSDGRVVPAPTLSEHDRTRAQYTIDTLNLNSPFLQVQRRRWWDELDELYQEHVSSEECLHYLAIGEWVPINGKLRSFVSLTRGFFGPLSERVLKRHAPELV